MYKNDKGRAQQQRFEYRLRFDQVNTLISKFLVFGNITFSLAF